MAATNLKKKLFKLVLIFPVNVSKTELIICTICEESLKGIVHFIIDVLSVDFAQAQRTTIQMRIKASSAL